MREQKINVKNTYVATVKNDIANKAFSFYTTNKVDNSIFVNDSVFPEVSMDDSIKQPEKVDLNSVVNNVEANDSIADNSQVVDVSENISDISIPQSVEVNNTIPVVEEPKVDNNVSEGVNVEPTIAIPSELQNAFPEPEPLADIPNLSILEPIPNVPVPPVNPQPIPNPVDTPSNPTPLDNNSVGVGTMVNQPVQLTNEPVRFDASHETNLLSALGENNGENSIGNINVTPENLNVVRDFGVDEPIVTSNNQELSSQSGGFINSKILLVVVIILFLASCVFLGYEIYNYFVLSK